MYDVVSIILMFVFMMFGTLLFDTIVKQRLGIHHHFVHNGSWQIRRWVLEVYERKIDAYFALDIPIIAHLMKTAEETWIVLSG